MDRSRLQLAIRSLETDRPVVRVAFLGLRKSGQFSARKLARVLLSDALSQEEAWERELLAGTDDGRSLLLRYGDPEEPIQSNPLVKTISVPSRYLERYNLEILITSLNANDNGSTSDTDALEDAILVPSLTTPNATGGRVGFVRYPVHKSVIVAEGVTGAIECGHFPSSVEQNKLILAAVNTPLVQRPTGHGADSNAADPAIDIDLADHALSLFRTSNANGAQFSDEWQTSRVPALSEWVIGTKPTSGLTMNRTVQSLVSSVISRVSAAVTKAADSGATALVTNTIADVERSKLQSAVSEWSADAHRDLQMNLDSAFAISTSWKRTTWWRLFWRIDDVSVSATDLLRQSWLKEAEQRLAFLSGRILESGLASVEQLQQPEPDQQDQHSFIPGELAHVPSTLSTMQKASGSITPFEYPWPPAISLSRLHLLNTLVPELHRKAQGLLLSTLSTIAGSTALAAWLYAATAGVALYGSGAILSLGLVWSLRRLQTRWEKERTAFASSTREDARRLLGEVESHLKKLVQQGGRAILDTEDARSWREARAVVERCQAALAKATHDG